MDITDPLRTQGVTAPWSFYLVTLAAMIALAVLDFVGAVAAKEWAEHRDPLWFLGGLCSFGVLFCVYAATLKVAELSIVTFGWIIFLQVGLLLFERFRYGIDLPPGKWAAVVLILALQAYLVLAPNGSETGT